MVAIGPVTGIYLAALLQYNRFLLVKILFENRLNIPLSCPPVRDIGKVASRHKGKCPVTHLNIEIAWLGTCFRVLASALLILKKIVLIPPSLGTCYKVLLFTTSSKGALYKPSKVTQ